MQVCRLNVVGREPVQVDKPGWWPLAFVPPGDDDALVDASVLTHVYLPRLVARKHGVDVVALGEDCAFLPT